MTQKVTSSVNIGAPLRHMLMAALLVQLLSGGVRSQIGDEPICDVDTAKLCFDNAVQSTQPSGCNWYRIIPPMFSCVDESTAGCTYDEQNDWYNMVYEYNATLQSDQCNPGCTGQANREGMMFLCFDSAQFSTLAPSISSNPSASPNGSQCSQLIGMNTCLQDATGGCPALTDVAYNIINTTQGGNAAYAICGISAFQPATTSAPLNILNTFPSQTPTPSPTKDNSVDGSDLLIIILGSLLILATILVIIVAICYACKRRREVKRRSLFYDWEPNGRRMYRDEPEIIRRETIDFRSASEGGKVYSPHRVVQERDEVRAVPVPREAYVNQGAVIYH